jgi:hypothetical protein
LFAAGFFVGFSPILKWSSSFQGKAQSHQAPLGQDPMSHQQDGECLGQGEEDQCHGWLGNSHDLNLIENLRAIMKARLKRTPNMASMPLFERAIKLILVKVLPIS